MIKRLNLPFCVFGLFILLIIYLFPIILFGQGSDVKKQSILCQGYYQTEEEAMEQDKSRSTDCADPLEEVEKVARRVVDFQELDRKYFKPTYSYFTINDSESAHEIEVKELQRRLTRMEKLFDDMEVMKYNFTFIGS